LWKAEFKGYGPIIQMEGISRQSSILAMAWLEVATFSQVYSENHKQKSEGKDMKNSL
jgi:hypothetical protein